MFRYSIIFIWFVLFGSVFGNTLMVCPNCEIKTIKEEIEHAKDFDTIRVQNEVYKEQEIIIDKPLTIIGIEYTTIDGQQLGEIIQVQSDNVTIDGFNIKNVNRSFTKDNAAV